ncbi:MAG: lytic transglycosylase domain-containing protein [Clostridia bacterium]|nr:lytic transglycosylase domain-containing protein [Clostridia bacterium]
MNTDPPKHSAHRPIKTFILFLLIAAMATVPLFAHLGDRINELSYPRKFRAEVEAAATRYGIEPNLIYAIIKAESGFCETAVSPVGAIGLMQILPDTFLFDIRGHVGLENARSSVLFSPEENILAGTYYFAHWYDYFIRVYAIDDPVVEALAAYNAGISHVWEWLEEPDVSDDHGLIADKIPFDETRAYVANILRYKEKYDALYPDVVTGGGTVSESLCYRYALRYGKDYRVDPCLVMAIIKAESDFDPHALSGSGAVGLMQIIDGTYADIKGDLSLTEDFSHLYNAEFNVKCGTYYLHWIDERISGVAQIAASYNAGLSAVEDWLTKPEYSADGETLIIENIPIDQTKNYVKNVLRYYEEFRAKYAN